MKKNNDDIISRRRFFKKAVGTILPAIAVVAFPGLLTSCEIDEPTPGGNSEGCTKCSGSCSSICTSSCGNSCRGNCSGSCITGCKGKVKR